MSNVRAPWPRGDEWRREMSTLKTLWDDYGQAVWLDYIERNLVSGDGLAESYNFV